MEFYTKVAGATFSNTGANTENRQRIIAQLSRKGILERGTELTLRRDPTNPYDANAVAVIAPDGRQLGFLPKDVAAKVSPDMVRGARYKAYVASVTGGDVDALYGINLKIVKEEAQAAPASKKAPSISLERVGTNSDLKEIIHTTEIALNGICSEQTPSIRGTPVENISGSPIMIKVEDFRIAPWYIDELTDSYGYPYAVIVTVGVVDPKTGNRYLDIYTPISAIPDCSFDERFTAACCCVCDMLHKKDSSTMPFDIEFLDGLVMLHFTLGERLFLSPSIDKRGTLERVFIELVKISKEVRHRLEEFGYENFSL